MAPRKKSTVVFIDRVQLDEAGVRRALMAIRDILEGDHTTEGRKAQLIWRELADSAAMATASVSGAARWARHGVPPRASG